MKVMIKRHPVSCCVWKQPPWRMARYRCTLPGSRSMTLSRITPSSPYTLYLVPSTYPLSHNQKHSIKGGNSYTYHRQIFGLLPFWEPFIDKVYSAGRVLECWHRVDAMLGGTRCYRDVGVHTVFALALIWVLYKGEHSSSHYRQIFGYII